MRFRGVLAVLVLLVVQLFCPVQLANAQPANNGVSGISASWNAFVNGVSVYEVLDDLGIVDFVDSDSGRRITVLWDGAPTIFLDGEVIENFTEAFEKHSIRVTSLIPDQGGSVLVTVFSINNRGNLVIETSDGDGYNGAQFAFNGNGTLAAMAHCRCVRNVLTTPAVPCTVAQCNDPGTTCGLATFFCKWMGAPPLARGFR